MRPSKEPRTVTQLLKEMQLKESQMSTEHSAVAPPEIEPLYTQHSGIDISRLPFGSLGGYLGTFELK